MTDPTVKVTQPAELYSGLTELGRKVPKPEELYLTPVAFVPAMIDMALKFQKTGAWWALAGDAGENILDVHVRPKEIEILTDKDGLAKIFEAASAYNPTPIAPMEKKLDREAQPDDKTYPVMVRSTSTEFTVKGAKVVVHSDYQMKIGEWEWGDSMVFDPVFVNVAGTQVPIMPLRLRSEMYIQLGWMDRAQLISEATQRAHAFVKQFGSES